MDATEKSIMEAVREVGLAIHHLGELRDPANEESFGLLAEEKASCGAAILTAIDNLQDALESLPTIPEVTLP